MTRYQIFAKNGKYVRTIFGTQMVNDDDVKGRILIKNNILIVGVIPSEMLVVVKDE